MPALRLNAVAVVEMAFVLPTRTAVRVLRTVLGAAVETESVTRMRPVRPAQMIAGSAREAVVLRIRRRDVTTPP